MLAYLLQVRLAKLSLERVRQRSWQVWQASSIQLSTQLSARPESGLGPRLPAQTAAAVAQQQQSLGYGSAPQGLLARQGYSRGSESGAGGLLGAYNAGAGAGAGAMAYQHQQQQGPKLLDPKQEELVLQDMSHFVTSLHQFVMDRLLYGAWMQLEQVRGQLCCGAMWAYRFCIACWLRRWLVMNSHVLWYIKSWLHRPC